MKECDKRNSHISCKLRTICMSSDNDRQPVTKTFTTLHYSCRHFTSSLLRLHPTIKDKGHPCTGTEALYRPYGP